MRFQTICILSDGKYMVLIRYFQIFFLKNFIKLSKYVCKYVCMEVNDEIISSGNQFTVNKKSQP